MRVLPRAQRLAGAEPLSWDILSVVREADLVHVHQVYSRQAEVAVLVAKLFGKPLCVTDHGGETSRLGRSLQILDLADRVTCYSEFGSSLLDTITPIRLVRGGVDDSFFIPPPEVRPTRDRLVFVGRLLPHKGIDRLLAALPQDVPLSVCGRQYDGQYFKYLQALSVGKQVEFLTDADDVAIRELYWRAIAVVLPSVYVDLRGSAHGRPELMGFSLLEGMACGAPGICSRVGGMPEYVDSQQTGYVYDELAQLTEAIERLAGDPSLVRTMGAEARQRVECAFGLNSSGAGMCAVYDELLAVAPP
jgi:glycosyltransferase involved in cell wall biosynthesis